MSKQLRLWFGRLTLLAALMLCVVSTAHAAVYLDESFENLRPGIEPRIPQGWESNGDIPEKWRFSPFQTGYEGRCIRFSSQYPLNDMLQNNNPNGKKEILTSPLVEPDGNLFISFWYLNPTGGPLSVYLSRDNGATYEGNPLLTNIEGVTQWTHFEQIVQVEQTDKIRLVFVAQSNAVSSSSRDAYNTAFASIDEVLIEDVPTCAQPIDLAITYADETSVMLMWNTSPLGGTSPSQYIIDLYKDNVLIKTETSPSTSVMLEELESEETYTAIIRGDCTPNHQQYSPASVINFTVPCPAQGIPYVENFDSQNAGMLPCWTVGGTSGIQPAIQRQYFYQPQGSDVKGSALAVASSVGGTTYAILPALPYDPAKPLEISCKAFATGALQRLEVGIVSSPFDFSTYTSLGSLVLQENVWQDCSFNTKQYEPFDDIKVFYPVIYSKDGAANAFYVDEISVQYADGCLRPTNIQITDIKPNEARVSWYDANGNNGPWKISYTAADGTPVEVDAPTNPFTLTGLDVQTVYHLKVAAVCGGQTSPYSSVATFTTPCEIYSLLDNGVYEQKFSSGTLPDCWTPLAQFTDKSDGKTYPRIGSARLQMRESTSVAACGFDLPANALRVRFEASATVGTTLVVGILKELNDPSGMVAVKTLQVSTGKNQFEVLMDESTAGGDYVVFYANGDMYIDNLMIDERPACLAPQNLKLDAVTANTATFSWTTREPDAAYSVTIDGSTPQVVNANSYTIQGLDAGMSYEMEVEIEAICGQTPSEKLTGELEFITHCEPTTITKDAPFVTTFASGVSTPPNCYTYVQTRSVVGTVYPRVQRRTSLLMNGGAGEEIVALPAFTNPISDLRILFSLAFDGDAAPTYPLEVGYLTDLMDPASFVALSTVNLGSSNLDVKLHLDKAPAEAKYIALRASDPQMSGTKDAFALSNIKVELIPFCLSNPRITAVTGEQSTTSITVTITDHEAAAAGITSWDIMVVPFGSKIGADDNIIINVTDKDAAKITGLMPSTGYNLYVRSHCGEDNVGDWTTEPFEASTRCETIVLTEDSPYKEQFKSYMSPCYTTEATGNVAPFAYSGGEILTSATSNVTGTVLLATPQFEVVGPVELRFKMTSTPNYRIPENVTHVYYNKTPNLEGATLLQSINHSSLSDATRFSALVPFEKVNASGEEVTTNFYILFQVVVNDKMLECKLDDIELAVADECFTPVIQSTTELTQTTLGFSAFGAAGAEFEFILKEAGNNLAVPDTLRSTNGKVVFGKNGKPLKPQTTYEAQVRTKCSPDKTSGWSATYSATTLCEGIQTVGEGRAYVDEFDDGVAETLRECWLEYPGLTVPRTASPGYDLSPQALHLTPDALRNRIAMPTMIVDDIHKYELVFQAYTDYPDVSFRIMLQGAGPEDVARVKDITLTETGVWKEQIVSFDNVNLAGTGVADNCGNIIFYLTDREILIDNVQFRVIPACPQVSDLKVLPLGDKVDVSWATRQEGMPVRVVLTWNHDLRIDTLYDEIHTEQQITIDEGILENTSGYSVVAQTVCDDASSVWTAPIEFKTACAARELPIEENFDSYVWEEVNDQLFPDCWTRVKTYRHTSFGLYPRIIYGNTAASGKGCLDLWSSSNEIMFALPEVAADLGELTLSFKYSCYSPESQPLRVGLLKDLSQEKGFRELVVCGKPDGIFEEMEITFPKEVLGKGYRYITFALNNGNYYIDDIKVTKTPPAVRPGSINVISATEASVTFDVVDQVNKNWEVAVVPSGVALDDKVRIQSADNRRGITYAGLEPATVYDIYVRGVSLADDYRSGWLKAESVVRTDCGRIDVFPYVETFDDVYNTPGDFYISSCWTRRQQEAGMGDFEEYWENAWMTNTTNTYRGNRSAMLLNGNPGTRTTLASPELAIATKNAYEVTFWMYREATADKPIEGVRVWANTTPERLDGATLLLHVTRCGGVLAPEKSAERITETGWYRYSAPIPVTGNTVHILFEGLNEGGQDVLIDEVVVRKVPSCILPSDVTIDTVGAAMVTFTIEDDKASKWDVVVVEQGKQPEAAQRIETIDTKTYTYTGLDESTKYSLYVRANCGNGDVSEWSRAYKFLTVCDPVELTAELEYQENFDSYPTGEMPDCWVAVLERSSADWRSPAVDAGDGTFSYASSKPGSIQLSAGTMVALPLFSNNPAELVWSMRFNGYGIIKLGTLSDPKNFNTFEAFTDVEVRIIHAGDSPDGIAGTAYTFDLSEYADKISGKYLALQADEENGSQAIYVDDVSIYYNNPCRRPDQVLVDVFGTESLQITINDERPVDEVAKWQYAVLPADTAIRPQYIKESVDRVISVTGLQAGTTYDVYVRPLCNAGEGNFADGNWSAKITVATDCVDRTISTGTSDKLNIEASNMPACWTIMATAADNLTGKVTPSFVSGTGFYFEYTLADNMVALPKYTNPLSDLQLTISAQSAYGDLQVLDVGYVTDLSDPSSFVSVQRIQAPLANAAETSVAFAGVDADGWIAIRGEATENPARAYVNALEVTLAAAFYIPRNFTVQEVRSTSVKARAVVGSETEKCHWQLARLSDDGLTALYTTDIFTTGSDKGILNIDTLQSSASYRLRVRAIKQNASISSDTTQFTNDIKFSTLCPEEMGLREHFKENGHPDCWTIVGEEADNAGNVALRVNIGADSLRFEVTATRTNVASYPTNSVFIALPPIAGLNKKYLAMDYTTDFAGSISVGTTKQYADFDSFNSLYDYQVGKDSVPAATTKGLFVPFNTVDVREYIAIRFTPNKFEFSCASGEDGCTATARAAVDSILVADITPETCLAPYDLEYVPETDHVVLTWKPGNTETTWEVQIDDNQAVQVTSPTYSISNLNHSTDYSWRVRISSVCNGTVTDQTLDERISTRTLCGAIEVTKENPYVAEITSQLPDCWEILRSSLMGGKSAPYVQDGIVFYGDNLVRTPEFFNQLNELTVILTAERDREGNFPKMEVGYLTDGDDPATFVNVKTLQLNAKLTDYMVDFDVDASLQGYVALRYSSRCLATVPKLAVRRRLACPDPVLSLKEATGTSITVTVETTASQVHLVRVPAGTPINPDTAKYETLTTEQAAAYTFDVQEDTEWDVYVRSACDAGETSYWISNTFVPLCSSLGGLPYTQDFDLFREGISVGVDGSTDATPGMPTDPANPARPDCWTYLCGGKGSAESGSGNIFLVDIEGFSKSNNTMMLRASTFDSNHNPVRAVMPYFGKDVRDLRLTFSYKTSESGSPEIGVMSDPNDESTYMMVTKLDRTTSYVQKDLSFENVPEGYGYLVFSMGANLQSETYLWIDDIRVSCLDILPTHKADLCANEDFIYDGIIINARELQPGQLNKKTVLKQVDNDGCDVLYTFELNVAAKVETIIPDTVCGGTEIYDSNGFENNPIDHPATKKYYLALETESGCDSIVVLDLYVHYPQHWEQRTVCSGELPLKWGDMEITETGIYRDTIPTGECDSISILDVVVMPQEQVTYETICEGDSVLFAGKQYKATGRYEIPNPDDEVCNSLLVLDLTVLPAAETIKDTICGAELPYTKWPGYEFYKTGTYERDIKNELSCDLHQTLYLTVLERDTAYVKDTVCFNSPYTGYNGLPASTGNTNITESTTVYCDDDNAGSCGFTYAVDLHMRPEVIGRDTVVVTEIPYIYNDRLTITKEQNQEYELPYYTTDDRFHCDSTLYVYAIISLTGLDETTAATVITLKPNPVERNQELTVDYDFTVAERRGMEIEIVNSLGQVISRQRPDTEIIRIEGFSVPGFYTVHIITGDNKRYAAKVLVK